MIGGASLSDLYAFLLCSQVIALLVNLVYFTSAVYLDAAVFGDTNLELPSALSNSSFIEIHMDLVPSSKDNNELVIELPLHLRYPVSSVK